MQRDSLYTLTCKKHTKEFRIFWISLAQLITIINKKKQRNFPFFLIHWLPDNVLLFGSERAFIYLTSSVSCGFLKFTTATWHSGDLKTFWVKLCYWVNSKSKCVCKGIVKLHFTIVWCRSLKKHNYLRFFQQLITKVEQQLLPPFSPTTSTWISEGLHPHLQAQQPRGHLTG